MINILRPHHYFIVTILPARVPRSTQIAQTSVSTTTIYGSPQFRDRVSSHTVERYQPSVILTSLQLRVQSQLLAADCPLFTVSCSLLQKVRKTTLGKKYRLAQG